MLGYYARGDGGGGTFYWDAGSSASDNGGTVIATTLTPPPTTGRWIRTHYDVLTLNMFGFAASQTAAVNAARIAAAFNALPSSGGRLAVLPGTYEYSAVPTVDVPIVLQGAGAGIVVNKRPTIFKPTAGVTGLSIGQNAQASVIADIYFLSQSIEPGSDDGIRCTGHGVRLESIVCENFGHFGFNLDTTGGGNVNTSKLTRCRAVGNRSHGFYCGGENSNVITYDTCDATSNTGVGFANESRNCTYLDCHADLNASGSFYDNGNSNQYYNPYVEGSPADLVLFDIGSSSILWLAGGISTPTIFDKGQNNTVVRTGLWELLRCKQIQLRGVPTPDITFIPISGAVKTGQVYQSGDTLYIADSGVSNIVQIELTTKAVLVSGPLYPATAGAAAQNAAAIYAGNGIPSNAHGSNSDFYFRSDGTGASNSVIYHKEAGAWVALVTT